MSKRFINLTKHPIMEVTSGKTFQPSGRQARNDNVPKRVATVDGIPIFSTKLGETSGIPDPEEGVIYIVSALALAGTARDDVVSPGVVQRIDGRVTGCIGFRTK